MALGCDFRDICTIMLMPAESARQKICLARYGLFHNLPINYRNHDYFKWRINLIETYSSPTFPCRNSHLTVNKDKGILYKTQGQYDNRKLITSFVDHTIFLMEYTIVLSSTKVIYGPSNTRVIYSPGSTRVIHGPSSTRVIYGTSSTRVSYGPSSTKVIYGPSSTRVIYGPSSTRVIYGPSSTSVIYGPSSTRFIYGPSSTRAIYGPSSTRVIYGPSNIRVMAVAVQGLYTALAV